MGIDFRPEAQSTFLSRLGLEFGYECDWPVAPTGDPQQFYTENTSFSYVCAAITHCVIRYLKPQHVIEVGSGNSSLVIAAALALNNKDSATKAQYTIVDPYPRAGMETSLVGLKRLIREPVELLDVSLVESLGKNDVLFIDSGHTVRIGGDVNYLILDILPRLAPGVIVHFHDVFLPYEYAKAYATDPGFRQFWTEAYLLQAFLCFNDQFEVLLAMNYMMTDHQRVFRNAFPLYDPEKHRGSESFWIRRKE